MTKKTTKPKSDEKGDLPYISITYNNSTPTGQL
jgi:hypothetical protein